MARAARLLSVTAVLASFVVLFPLNAADRTGGGKFDPAYKKEKQDELYNYGRTWTSLSNYTRDFYLWGFRDGLVEATFGTGTVGTPPPILDRKTVEARWESLSWGFDYTVIRDVVSDLYKDPANAFIPFPRMVYIARDKLKGQSIGELLRKERNRAVELHRALNKPQP